MNLSEFVSFNESFQSSVNIAFDFGSKEKVSSLIPTESVCHFLGELLKDVIAPSHQRAKLLVGPYGTGKSHITLAALSAMWLKGREHFDPLITACKDKHSEGGSHFGDALEHYVTDGARLLPVIVSGSSSDLQRSLLYALRTSLQNAGLGHLMPRTNFSAARECIDRWRKEYPETLHKLEELTGLSFQTIDLNLAGMDTATYDQFVELYPQLTSGSTFDALDGANTLEIYDQVLNGLKREGINGAYVVYDEFSKYLESNIQTASVEDTKLLQDFAEKCNRSAMDQQLHLLLISHKSLGNYIDSKLPKDKVDGWRGVSGRFREIEIRNSRNQSYELMANAIVKDKKIWNEYLSSNLERIERVGYRYVQTGLIDAVVNETVAFGAFPLHPMTAFILPELSGRIAQNERTLFTFLCSTEENSLSKVLQGSNYFVSPDTVYDYFNPLMRRESFEGKIHQTYELARKALRKFEDNSLEAKIIKTLALITMIARYEILEPKRNVIEEVYLDCGYSEDDVADSFSELRKTESVIYLRQSNDFFKLKESSGFDVNDALEDRKATLGDRVNLSSILNEHCRSTAVYPSRYNDEHCMVRYFRCGFVSAGALRNCTDGFKPDFAEDGDGYLAAIFPESPEDMADIEELAIKFSKSPMSVFVVPKHYSDISSSLLSLKAAEELRAESEDDEVLAEEYNLIAEDHSEIVTGFINGYFSPEKSMSRYYIAGHRKNGVARRRKLSELLSDLCEASFPNAPVITNEALNKRTVTGTARSSRSKILAGLCARDLQPNLGFVGNGQETSMARSVLQRTGLIADLTNPVINTRNATPEVNCVLSVIEEFITTADHTTFSVLYDRLEGAQDGIGLRKGLVPIFLAAAMRNHRDEIAVFKNDSEVAYSAVLLDSIDATPASFQLSILNWNDEMAGFVAKLGALFGCEKKSSKSEVVEAMRRWFVCLPQVVRNSRKNHGDQNVDKAFFDKHKKFLSCLRNANLTANDLLFSEIPNAFDSNCADDRLLDAIKAEKHFCDNYVDCANKRLSIEIRDLIKPNAPEGASLDSLLRDWLSGLGPSFASHVFSGLNNNIISAIKGTTPDEKTTVARIAKSTSSLRIEDWNDSRFEEFPKLIEFAVREAENLQDTEESFNAESQTISYIDADGQKQDRVFKAVACSTRGKMLKRSIAACVAEMGESITADEKRQVVFDVLRELCR